MIARATKNLYRALAAHPSAEDVRSVLVATPVAALLTAVNATIYAIGVGDPQANPFLIIWLIATLTACWFLARQSQRSLKRKLTRVSIRTARKLVCVVPVLALPWAVLPVYVFGFKGPGDPLMVQLVCAGMMAGGAFILHRTLLAAFIFQSAIAVPVLVAFHMGGMQDAWTATAYALVYLVALTYFAYLVGETARERDASVAALLKAVEVVKEARDENLQLAKKAQSSAEARARFLANMSHEIRTPMNGIIGMSELLAETSLSADQMQYTATIRDSSQALLTLINDVLDVSKIESGKFIFVNEAVSIPDLAYDVVQLVSGTATEKNLEIIVEDRFERTESFCSGWFQTDPARLRQVLLNVVGNAVKFTGEGQVHVLMRAEYHSDQSDMVVISVSDTGIGIPEHKQSAIFNVFEQADTSISRQFEGSGLGLSISQNIVTAMGGSIEVESIEGRGTTFTICIPMQRYVGTSTGFRTNPPFDGKSARILCSNHDFGRVLTGILKHLGFSVAASAPPDLKAIDSPESADVLLLDLPASRSTAEAILAGFEAALFEHPKILVLTPGHVGRVAPALAEKPLIALRKPVRPQMIENALHSMLSADRPSTPSGQGNSTSRTSLTGLRILVAEDNRTNQLVVQRMLLSTGAILSFAENGSDAVEFARETDFDLILMDVSMPVMDGLTATRAIRELQASSATGHPCPILALTANAMAEDRENCRRAGMDDVLTKPVRKQDLLSAIEQWALGDPAYTPVQDHRVA